ncbi:MAG TPA: RluA family pseudouridine synthase [Bacteroidales bacterium]|nr:RluA family pseudouridine synthase [Bacteroidales bacterium]
MNENEELTANPEVPDENGDLYEHYHFTVDKGQALLRIDKYLTAHIQNISRNKLQLAAKADCILVNDKPVKSNYRVKPLDVISIVLTFPPRDVEIYPENIPLTIVYEDEDLVVVNKNAGMVVHPAYANFTGTLVNALLYHFQNSGLPYNEETKPYLAHRIDKDTSGLLLIAKNELAQSRLAKQFFNHTVERRYIALVWGNFDDDEGTITGNLGRSPKDRRVMTVFPEGDYGKHAVTHYKVLERFGYVTLIECRLETGRTHQIRAHMRYIGHPLFNDETYGGNEILKGTTFSKYKQFIANCFKLLPRQALHARSLGFIHPSTGKFVLFESELPQDMQAVIEKWRSYSNNKDILKD